MTGEQPHIVRWPSHKYADASLVEREEQVAVEMPLTIELDGEEFATMLCSPSDLEPLVYGFLASEGMIRAANQVDRMDWEEDRGIVKVTLKTKPALQKDFYSRRYIGSCCGKSRQFYFYNDVSTAKTIMTRVKVSVQQCIALMEMLHARSSSFSETGGVHNAGLCTPDELLLFHSDIGRHNALDKIYGSALLQNMRTSDKIIAFSGRISSEIVLKVSKIGCGLLLSKSAPTDLGLQLANDLGITAVGFLRRGSMNIYTHPERIVDHEVD